MTSAAMVRVLLVQSMIKIKGETSNLASSAVLVAPSGSMLSYRPRFPSMTEMPSSLAWLTKDATVVWESTRKASRSVAGLACGETQPTGVYVVGSLFDGMTFSPALDKATARPTESMVFPDPPRRPDIVILGVPYSPVVFI